MDAKGFDRVAFSFKESDGNCIDNIGEKALYACETLKKCEKCFCVLEKKKVTFLRMEEQFFWFLYVFSIINPNSGCRVMKPQN